MVPFHAAGKAAGASVGLVVLGALVGTAVESWLRVDIVPLGSFASECTFQRKV